MNETTGTLLAIERAVIYDSDPERAAQVADVLRSLRVEPLPIDHAALMRAVIQTPGTPLALLIGDVDDCDWVELGAALREQLGDVPVVVYGSESSARQLAATLGPRVQRQVLPFNHTTLAASLRVPAQAAFDETRNVTMPTGISRGIREVTQLIRQVAAHDSSVLVLGESGTGKEVVARAIHDASPRRARPFVAVNCGAIPAELLESELFGHEKGAFTGAISARKGRFEIAEGGTLFLDEIGDMSLPMQVKLLRVLQERAFERVGNHTSVRCNVRIIAATHRNLEDAIARDAFREDLFYRLNVFPIEMPALRERSEDLPLLVREFSRRSQAAGRGKVELSRKALMLLSHYRWPGNVRELGNLIERLSILCPNRLVDIADLPPRYRPEELRVALALDDMTDGAVDAEAVGGDVHQMPGCDAFAAPDEPRDMEDREVLELLTQVADVQTSIQLPPGGMDLRDHLFTIERDLIRQALGRAGGTVAHAARLLKLRRTTLVEKLRKFQMLNETAAEV